MTVAALLFVALAQAPAGPTTLSGRVVNAEGRPAGGVEVLLSGIVRPAGAPPVLARAKSDDRGRFRIDVPPEKDPWRAGFPLALWAYAPKAGLAGQVFERSALPAEGSLQLKLGGPVHAAVRVVGPDGKPVAGARVVPLWVRVAVGIPPRSLLSPPDALADLLGATTDALGEGEIQGLRSDDIEAVWVEAAGFGRQRSELFAGARGAPSITLKPAGRLNGRVEADDPGATRGLEVIAMTPPRNSVGPQTSGEGCATTNAEGRFEIAALAAGKLVLNVFPAEGAKLRPQLPSNLTIEPGKTTVVTIRLDGPPRLRTVAGRVIGKGGQPVAGATVFQTGDSPAQNRSRDRRGRALPVECGHRAPDVPVRPEIGLPLRRPWHRARVARRHAHDPQGGRAAPVREENASAPFTPRGGAGTGAPAARSVCGARSQTGGRGGEGPDARSARSRGARACARADRQQSVQ